MPPNSVLMGRSVNSLSNDLEQISILDMQKRKRSHVQENEEVVSQLSRSHSLESLTESTVKKLISHEVLVTTSNAIRPIDCALQTYAWGRVGSLSTAARLKASQSDGEFEVDEFTPYAELWVGTHPNGMSTIRNESCSKDNSISLLNYVNGDPKLHCGNEKANNLTYLLKVLSINKVLSIQAHPDKALAEKLHAERPDVYKDGNHKPEMAIAITDNVEGMCGFLPISKIVGNLERYPELYDVVGREAAEHAKKNMNTPCLRHVYQKLFRSYMEAPTKLVRSSLNSMLRKLRSIHRNKLDLTQILMMRLADQFPGDPGIFAPLMLNYIHLKRGEAFFIGANEPHAYVSGEIVECMACSDNVVRAGLTPKLKDIDTLVSMLTYEGIHPKITRGEILDRCTTLYEPPVSDFAVEFITVPSEETYVIRDVQSPAVLLTLSGSATLAQGNVQSLQVGFGSSYFMSANTRATIVAGKEGVTIVRGMSNVYF